MKLWRRCDQRGFIANRGIGFGLAGLALVACGFGLPGHGGGTDVTSPTTTLPTTTTTASTTTTVTVSTTTSTTVPGTTTTIPGGDPCTGENLTTSGFPCLASAGVHGVTFTASNTTANNGTSCTVCPAGMTWSGGSYRINSCVTINGWKITDDVDILASNGHKQIYGTEGAAVIGACVKLTHVLIVPPEPGRTNEVALSTGFANFSLDCSFGGAPATCGPVYLADSEVSMNHPAAAGTCGNDGSGNAIPCNTGFSYAVTNTNQHLWRDYLHGTAQGIDTDGYSEVHDSVMRADRSDQLTIDVGHSVDHCKIGPSGFGIEVPNAGAGIHDNCSGHGDAYFQDSGASPWMLVDHDSVFCGASMLFCNVAGAYIGDQSAPSGGVVMSTLFKKSTGVNFCMAAGASESGKSFPQGNNLTFKNNVYEIGPGACTHTNAVKTWGAAGGNHFCNNRMDDGTLVNASFETGSCP